MTAVYLADPGTIAGRELCGYCQCKLSRHAIRQFWGEAEQVLKTRIYCMAHDSPCLVIREERNAHKN